MYLTSVLIGGNEFVDVVRKDAVEISVESNGRTSSASLELLLNIQRDGSNYAATPQQPVVIRGSAEPVVIPNPGFEQSGLDSRWTLETGWSVVSSDALHGVRCLRRDANSSLTVAKFVTPCAPGDLFTLASSARTNTNGTGPPATMNIGFRTPDLLTYLGGASVFITGDTWTRYETSMTAPAGAGYVLLFFQLTSSATTGRLLIDDVLAMKGTPSTLFSGYVSRVEPRIVSPGTLRYGITCQGSNRILDGAMVVSKAYASKTDKYVLDDLFATYLPAITTTGVVSTATLDSITFANESLRACVEKVCDRTGAEWRLGFDSDLKYHAIGANDAPFDFSENANGGSTEYYLQSDFGYQEEFSAPANTVSVIGYTAPRPDAVTVSFGQAVSADDGFAGYYGPVGSGWPPGPGGTPVNDTATTPVAFEYLVSGGTVYSQTTMLFRFDTASIPDDAVIESAKLRLYLKPDSAGFEPGTLLGFEHYASANWPIESGDYLGTLPAYPDAVGYQSLNGLTINQWQFVEYPLSNVSTVSKTGPTGIRGYLRCPGPSQINRLWVVMSEGSAAERPALIVTYRLPQPAPITGSYTDSASVTAYGTLQRTITDNSITTAGEANARAQVETQRFANPQKSINVTYDRDGLSVGDAVHFTSTSLGLDADYIIKRLRLRWPAGQSKTRYSAELGQYRPDLVEFLRKI